MKLLLKALFLWLIGGTTYYIVELLWRGRSHWTMFILGGVCFVAIGLLNEFFSWDMALVSQMLISAMIITVLELLTGIIVNKWLFLGVWDYSQMPYNFMGQICLLYSNLWLFLSLVAIIIDDYIRYFFMGENKPNYKVI